MLYIMIIYVSVYAVFVTYFCNLFFKLLFTSKSGSVMYVLRVYIVTYA